MISISAALARRWGAAVILLVVFVYLFHKHGIRMNTDFTALSHTSSAAPKIEGNEPQVLSPPKIYDDRLLTEAWPQRPGLSEQQPLQKIPENPQSPLFPAFRASSVHLTSQIYDPYPNYNSKTWRRKWKSLHVPCRGPSGQDISGDPMEMLHAFSHENDTMLPDTTFGSFTELGLDTDHCFDRFARYGVYGLVDEDASANSLRRKRSLRDDDLDWSNVDWMGLQQECFDRNQARFSSGISMANTSAFWIPSAEDFDGIDDVIHLSTSNTLKLEHSWLMAKRKTKDRTGIVVHTTAAREWTVDMTQYLRSMIEELSLHSGSEFEVILLIRVADADTSIFVDETLYGQRLQESVPLEFIGLAILWNEALLDEWYSEARPAGTPVIQSHTPDQPLQLLSLLRPDLEHFWSVNPSTRYTGHHYQHLETLASWADFQPRRLLWERSSAFFMPSTQTTYARFREHVGNQSHSPKGGVWGPVRVPGIEPVGPQVPFATAADDTEYTWGVGEPADLISSGPVIEATKNAEQFAKNYPRPESSTSHPKPTPARNMTSTFLTRYSKRLLRAMHHGQINLGVSMGADQYAASTALHHGLKVVAVPIPIFLDYAKSSSTIDNDYNYHVGGDGAKSQPDLNTKWQEVKKRLTVFGASSPGNTAVAGNSAVSGTKSDDPDMEGSFADEIYKRWLGYGKDPTERLCLPGMLLHPVQGV